MPVDLGLSDGSGADVAHAACAENIPVLIVTGRNPDEIEAVGLGCLTKPYKQRDLIAAIDICEALTEGKALSAFIRPAPVPARRAQSFAGLCSVEFVARVARPREDLDERRGGLEAGVEARKRSIGEVMLPYVKPRQLAALLLGISSGFPLRCCCSAR
ncbi:hypothetical protein [Sphingomonas sp. J315]|uniref:hypothetical protein n=1 Tax=Sphingomonas sp. J315 TaxID=2898433 RepID=UPI0021AD6816|nr:hypothetical protein [Sphingomonas sp. J315]UUX99617.1 hypothetical protein LRS08_00010 [Sphingomonas sp. J315]